MGVTDDGKTSHFLFTGRGVTVGVTDDGKTSHFLLRHSAICSRHILTFSWEYTPLTGCSIIGVCCVHLVLGGFTIIRVALDLLLVVFVKHFIQGCGTVILI